MSIFSVLNTAGTRPEPRPWKAALGWLAFLGPFFFASYGLANWIASLDPQVRTIVFDWERHIPFWAWTIVPYWLIDPLYGLSLFLCATRKALRIHVRRLLTAQLIAVGCFLLFPLRYSFTRPEVSGILGWMFDVLSSFDQPFNQAPSLHIALLVILWSVYLQAVPRALRWLVHASLLLIGVSVLTTWQHHFIDIPSGAWLGWLCIWLHPDDKASPLLGARSSIDSQAGKLAVRYVLAAIVLGGVSVVAGGAWLWLLWGCGSLALVGAIYAFGDEAAFQKRADGSIAPAALWLLGPYFLGAWLNSRWWTRKRSVADPVIPGLLVGRVPTRGEAAALNVGAIVDVSAELPCPSGGARYINVPMLDLIVPSGPQIERVSRAIAAERRRGTVLVCCALGFSRSALAVAAWLLRERISTTPEDAVTRVREARPQVVLDPPHLAALVAWYRDHAGHDAR